MSETLDPVAMVALTLIRPQGGSAVTTVRRSNVERGRGGIGSQGLVAVITFGRENGRALSVPPL